MLLSAASETKHSARSRKIDKNDSFFMVSPLELLRNRHLFVFLYFVIKNSVFLNQRDRLVQFFGNMIRNFVFLDVIVKHFNFLRISHFLRM